MGFGIWGSGVRAWCVGFGEWISGLTVEISKPLLMMQASYAAEGRHRRKLTHREREREREIETETDR